MRRKDPGDMGIELAPGRVASLIAKPQTFERDETANAICTKKGG